MVIDKNLSKILCFTCYFLSLRFVRTVFFVSSIIASHIITELFIIFSKYLTFLQLHEVGFKT